MPKTCENKGGPRAKSARYPKSKHWRHASKYATQVSRQAVAALALMNMGVRDYSSIATAVGLTEQEVERIDLADDVAVKRLGAEGIPEGEYFKLANSIRCPKCNASIHIVPCVACACRSLRADR